MKKVFTLVLVLVFALGLCGCSTDFNVFASLIVDGEENETVANSYAVVGVNTDSDPAVLNVKLFLAGAEEPMEATITAGEEGLGFTVPGIIDDYYLVKWDAFKDFAEETSSVDIDQFTSLEALGLSQEDAMELVSRYIPIFTGLITEENMKTEEGEFVLYGLEETVPCQVTTICPTEEDWTTFFKDLATTAQSDEQLKTVLETCFKTSFATGTVEDADQYADADDYAAKMLAGYEEFLADVAAQPETYASAIAGVTVEWGNTEDYFYGARALKDGVGGGYESFTVPAENEGEGDTRYDGIFYYEDGAAQAVLVNALTITDEEFSTYAYSDLADFSAGVVASNSEVNVLGVPTADLYISVAGYEASLGSMVGEDDTALFYFNGVTENGDEFNLQAESDGSPSSVTAPAAEPVVISTSEELMSLVGAFTGAEG